jgi:hypothetical protein
MGAHEVLLDLERVGVPDAPRLAPRDAAVKDFSGI